MGGWGGGGGFTKNPNLKKNFVCVCVCVCGGGGGGRGIHKESKSKKKNFVCGGGRWMDRRTGPNQFASLTSSKLGGITALMYKLCP